MPVYKPWYELTREQRAQAFDLDGDVRQSPSAYVYEIDQYGNVVDYKPVFESE